MTKQSVMLSLIAAALVLFLSPLEATNILKAQGKRTGDTNSRQSMIGNIKNDSVAEGCGCYFSYPYYPIMQTRRREL